MDRLDAMTTLLAVVEAGSLSAAARRLHKPLATVSRKVSDLEKHLGARLLVRSTRKLNLTDSGQSYVRACRRILDDVQLAEQSAAGEYSTPRGELVITAPMVFGRLSVLPVVTQFLSAYEQINVRLVLADRIMHLVDDHIDVAVRIGSLPDSRLTASPLGQVRQVVCASPDYFAREGVPDRPQALSMKACIAIDNGSRVTQWHFGAGKRQTAITLRPQLTVTSVEAARDAAIAGAGLTRLLSYQASPAVRKGQLEVVLPAFESPPMPVSLVYDAQGAPDVMPLKLRAFLDFAKPRLREHLVALDLPT